MQAFAEREGVAVMAIAKRHDDEFGRSYYTCDRVVGQDYYG